MSSCVMPADSVSASVNSSLSVLTWQALEAKRYRSLRLPSRYSRYFNVTRELRPRPSAAPVMSQVPAAPAPVMSSMPVLCRSKSELEKRNNSLAPFVTEQKPTCGYYFTRDTDNRKLKIGVPPTDLVKYRYFSGGNAH